MENPFELPKEMLHEVIIRTLEITNISNTIIRKSFGLSLKFGEKEENYRILNANEINRFNDFFLENFGASSRADILLEIVKDTCKCNEGELKHCKDFKNKLIDFYKIRNIFAHNIFPKDLKGNTRLESSTPYWLELNQQHINLHKKLNEFLSSNCFDKR